MPYTRRQFAHLLQAGTAMTMAGFGAESLAAEPAVAAGPGLSQSASRGEFLSRSRFAPLAGTDFRVRLFAGASGTLTLLAVEEVRYARQGFSGAGLSAPKSKAPEAECTLLRFSAHGLELAEGTHQLTHDILGQISLHLSPGQAGRYLATLAHLPSAYLERAEIPRRQAKPTGTAVA